MKIGQNMRKIWTDTKKKIIGLCDFYGPWYWSFKIFCHIFSHLAKCLFFSFQEACQTNSFSIRTAKICQNQPRGKSHTRKISWYCHFYEGIYRSQLIWHALYMYINNILKNWLKFVFQILLMLKPSWIKEIIFSKIIIFFSSSFSKSILPLDIFSREFPSFYFYLAIDGQHFVNNITLFVKLLL